MLVPFASSPEAEAAGDCADSTPRQNFASRKVNTNMRSLKLTVLAAGLAAVALAIPARQASAQVSFGVNIGAAPACPYGYYDYAPYRCAPYGYYGPEWFNGGVFLGAGPWFHGGDHFHGHVNYAYDPRHGYHGAFPERGGAYHEPNDHWNNFHASHYYDGHAYHDDRGFHHDDHGHDHH
jgi:hypothetical protein